VDDVLSLGEVCKRFHTCTSNDTVWRMRFATKFARASVTSDGKLDQLPSGTAFKALFGKQQTLQNQFFSKSFSDRLCHLAGLKTPLTCMRLFGSDRVVINSGPSVRIHDMIEGKLLVQFVHHEAEVHCLLDVIVCC
jgi:hypothetical protein